MSYHTPHTLTEAQLREMESQEGISGEVKEQEPMVIWEVYEYDWQTGRYERPYALFTEEAAAQECKRERGMMGLRQLVVWSGLEEWKRAGKPNYAD